MQKSVLRALALLALTLCSTASRAAWLNDVPITLTQPDGSAVDLLASGDEFYNWVHDAEGFVVLWEARTGELVYATKRNGEVVPTEYRVGQANPSALGLRTRVMPDADVMRSYRELRMPTPVGPKRMGDAEPAARTGTVNNIVIFIRFSDEAEYTTTVSTYEAMLNGTTGNSLFRYYREASYDQLTINSSMYPTTTGSTIVSYQDTQPRNYYRPYDAVTNPIGYPDDTQSRLREHALLVRATNAVKAQIPTSLNLDTDNDGNVDNIVFVVWGSPGAWSSLLWPHAWALYSYDVRIGGKRVWSYSLQINNSTLSSGVGVLAHETGHTLGMPDLYRYNDGEPNDPIGRWDVMAANMNPPQHMGAFMKWRYMKWIANIPEITTSGTYSLNPLYSSTNNCYKIKSPNSSTEYYVVEYRRRAGTFENSLPGSGLLVYRVNTARDGSGNAQGPPDEYYVYRPNGTTLSDGSINSAYFTSSLGRSQITDTTNPSGFLSNGNPGGLNITNIGVAGSSISFTVNITGPVPSQMKFALAYGESRAGEILPFPVRIGLMNPANQLITTWNQPVTVAIKPGTGDPTATLLGTKTVVPINGIAQFRDLRVDKPGSNYVLTATCEQVPPADSVPFNVVPFQFQFNDTYEALRYAAGFDSVPDYRMPVWDAVTAGGSAGRVDMDDVAAILRKASGLEANP